MEDTTMKRHRHIPEQIVRKLREGDRLLSEGRRAYLNLDQQAFDRTFHITR
jgi:hypothetical protein